MDKAKAEFILQGLAKGVIRLKDLSVASVQDLAESPDLTLAGVQTIASEFGGYPLIGKGLGRNPDIPLEWLKGNWGDSIIEGVLERNLKLDRWLFQDIFWFAGQELKIQMVARDDVPEELLPEILRRSPNNHRLLAMVATNPKTQLDVLLTMLEQFKSFSPVGPHQPLASLIVNPKVPLEMVSAYFNHPNATVRQALARRSDVGKLQVGLQSLAKDTSDDVRQALSGNPFAPTGVALQLLDDPSYAVKYDAVAFGNLPEDKLEELARSDGITLRNLVMLNSHLSGESRLKLAVQLDLVHRPVKAAKNRIRRCPGAIPPEVALCEKELLKGPAQKPCNRRLGQEVASWCHLEAVDGVYLVAEEEWEPQEVLRQIRKIRYSAEERRKVAGWRPAGEKEWELFFYDLYGDYIEKEGAGKFLLPEAVDGWMLGGRTTEGRGWVIGASGRGDQKSVIWATPALPLQNRPAFPAVDLAPTYPEGDKLERGRRTVAASLVGSLILKGGIYALWRRNLQLVGWTQEICADLIPSQRDLNGSDLAASSLLKVTLPVFMAHIRGQNSARLNL